MNIRNSHLFSLVTVVLLLGELGCAPKKSEPSNPTNDHPQREVFDSTDYSKCVGTGPGSGETTPSLKLTSGLWTQTIQTKRFTVKSTLQFFEKTVRASAICTNEKISTTASLEIAYVATEDQLEYKSTALQTVPFDQGTCQIALMASTRNYKIRGKCLEYIYNGGTYSEFLVNEAAKPYPAASTNSGPQ